MRVYLSPSQQQANIGVGRYGSEASRCQDIADGARRLLRAAGVNVRQTPRSWEPIDGIPWLNKVVAASNAYRPQAHICIHTNAGGHGADGTDAWYHPGSAKGKRLTEAVYKRVAKVSPGTDQGIHTSPVFAETRLVHAPVCYIELAFHTDKEDAASIIKESDDYSRALAEGIAAYLGVKLPAEKKARIKLTGRDISVPRMYKPHRAGWWNFKLVPYIKDIREQGDGDRVVAGNADPLIIPVPVEWPRDLGRYVYRWKKKVREAALAAAVPPEDGPLPEQEEEDADEIVADEVESEPVPEPEELEPPRKRSPFWWRFLERFRK